MITYSVTKRKKIFIGCGTICRAKPSTTLAERQDTIYLGSSNIIRRRRRQPREHVALEFAETLTRDSNRAPDQLFAELRRHFEEGEIIEIGAVAGIFNYFNRLNNALQVEPTK